MTTNAFLLQQTWLIITQNGASPYWLIGGKCSSRGTTSTHPIALAHSKSSRSASLLLRHPLILSSHRLVVVFPLDAPPFFVLLSLPSRRLVVSLSRRLIILPCPPLVVSSCQLVVTSSLIVLSLCRPLVLSSCRLVVALPLLAPPSCPLVVPAIFVLPSPCRSPSPTPSNTVECCLRHQMPPPLPPLNAVSIVH